MTATCSVCGPLVAMRAVGKYFACKTARTEAQHAWVKAHPDRARESHKVKPSKHRLTNRDGKPDTCAICGPVDVVPAGRGYECGPNSRARGVKNPPLAPQLKCQKCMTVFLTRDGVCLECDTHHLIGADYLNRKPSKNSNPDDTLGVDYDPSIRLMLAEGFYIRDNLPLEGDAPRVKGVLGQESGHWWDTECVLFEYASLYGTGVTQ